MSREHEVYGSSENIDKLLEENGLNRQDFEIEKATFHAQETKEGKTHKQFWIRVKRKETAPLKDEEWQEQFLASVKEKAPPNVELPKTEYKLLSEINLSDPHFRMLSWDKETGVNYDLDITESVTRESGLTLLKESVALGAGKIVLVIGSDMFHADSNEPFTKRAGNLLDVDSRYQKGFEVAYNVVKDIIDAAIHTYEIPIDVIPIPGNHDSETVYFLGRVLHAYYHNQESVTIDTSPKYRKYYRWGKCLVGLSHGDSIKKKDVPNIMSRENPEISWADCPFREYHMGHIHHEEAHDEKGTVLRWVNAIAPEDAWHYRQGYIGSVKGSQAFLFDKNLGLRHILYHRINYPVEEI